MSATDHFAEENTSFAHPQDPEQQAVEAWMRGMDFVLVQSETIEPQYLRTARDGWEQIVMWPYQATFFYRTHQAQVAEACDKAIMHGKGVLAAEIMERLPNQNIDKEVWDRLEYLRDTFAQLNPQKPKENK